MSSPAPAQAREIPPVWPADAVFTVGHSTRQLDAFIALVQAYGVRRIADIRTVPRSRRNPQFNAETLGPALAGARLDYTPLPALGGLRRAHKDSPNRGWRNDSFRGYADYMQTEGFADGLAELIGLAHAEPTAIMCAEAVPWRCHRSLVADALLVRGIPAVEILSETSWRLHALTPFAHVDGCRITYPAEQPAAVRQ
jgi:uncharacterized protein (DUF488 family)